jgi:hypothetical protein
VPCVRGPASQLFLHNNSHSCKRRSALLAAYLPRHGCCLLVVKYGKGRIRALITMHAERLPVRSENGLCFAVANKSVYHLLQLCKSSRASCEEDHGCRLFVLLHPCKDDAKPPEQGVPRFPQWELPEPGVVRCVELLKCIWVLISKCTSISSAVHRSLS